MDPDREYSSEMRVASVPPKRADGVRPTRCSSCENEGTGAVALVAATGTQRRRWSRGRSGANTSGCEPHNSSRRPRPRLLGGAWEALRPRPTGGARPDGLSPLIVGRRGAAAEEQLRPRRSCCGLGGPAAGDIRAMQAGATGARAYAAARSRACMGVRLERRRTRAEATVTCCGRDASPGGARGMGEDRAEEMGRRRWKRLMCGTHSSEI